ncbi:hypothetical protein GGI12_003278 [Dipsacomyces acuminosporus]|nr:hypothetical protein GGI12_003278 [Dipsacomyces acuminosporus]
MSTTAASKYANLPDIDTEQPDIYETPDVAQADDAEAEEHEAPLSEDISVDKLAVGQAAARFRTAAGDVDGKSALARYQRSLFRTLQLESLSGDLEVAAAGGSGAQLKETPEQRLRRLVYETRELKEQLEKGSEKDGTQGVALMRLVNGLQDELSQLSVKDSQAAGAGSGLISRSLWERLDGSESAKNGSGHDAKQHPAKPAAQEDVSLLEKRIALLEKTLGASSARPAKDGSVGHNLVDSVSRLRQQMDVLTDPHRIDGIQRRVKQVLVDLDRLDLANTQANKAALDTVDGSKGEGGARLDPATVKRIDELYEKFTKIDSLIELAPATARRLQSLSQLHVEASEAVARIDRIEKEQGNIGEELATMKEIATGLKDSIGENSATLKENMKFLDSRIAALSDRISALQK